MNYLFFFYIILTITMYALSVYGPYLQSLYIDKLLSSSQLGDMMNIMIKIINVSIITILLSYISTLVAEKISKHFEFSLVSEMISHLHKIPYLRIREYNPAYLNQRINQDGATLAGLFIGNIVHFPLKWLVGIAQLIFIYKIEKDFFYVGLFYIPVYLTIYILSKQKIYDKEYSVKEEENNYYNSLYKQFHYVKEIKLSGQFEYYGNLLKKSYKKYFSRFFPYIKFLTLLNSCEDIFMGIFNLIILYIGAVKYFDHKITIGNISLVLSYFSMIAETVQYYLEFGKVYQAANVSYSRMHELEMINEENNGSIELKNIEKIRAINLDYSYEDCVDILNNITFTLEKGKIYLFSGGNGSGKTTLVNILVGLMDDFKGKIKINDIDIENIDLYFLRRNNICILSQSYHVQDILVKDYITMNLFKDNLGIDNIEKNWNKLNNFGEMNISQYLYSNLLSLSGGELKKLRLLIGLNKDCDVLILDEPDTALDVQSLKFLKEEIQRLKREKIILLITHNKYLADAADEIITINNKVNFKTQ